MRGTPSPGGRAAQQHPGFIHECPSPRPRCSELVAVVDAGLIAESPATAAVAVRSSAAPPLCHPLFAGWCDFGTFRALVAKDVARLQRIAARQPPGATSRGGAANRALQDPEACVVKLAAMLAPPASDVPALAPPPRSGSRVAPPRAPGAGSGHISAAGSGRLTWQDELALRAAHLEVLLALLADVMAAHVTAGTATSESQVADSAGCPSTRVGWVEAAVGYLQSLERRSVDAAAVHTPPPLSETLSKVPVVCLASVSAAVQTVPVTIRSRVRFREVALQATAEMRDESTSCCPGQSGSAEVVAAPAGVCDAACSTEESWFAEMPKVIAVGVDVTTQADDAEASQPASPPRAEAAVQCGATELRSAGCQTESLATAAMSCQTEPPPQAPQPPSVRGGLMGQRRLGAEEASRQLDVVKAKLALEKEASALLEAQLQAACDELAAVRRAGEEHRRRAAGAREEAEALAAAAHAVEAARPRQREAAAQASADVRSVEAQTDAVTYWSHSWQACPSGSRGVPEVAAAASVAVQTAEPPRHSACVQTDLCEPQLLDACVGSEEPLPLVFGAALAEPWRDQFSQGMEALARGWQTRFAESEGARAREEVERRRLESLLSAAPSTSGGELGVCSGTAGHQVG